MGNFRKLKVWQAAKQISIKVYKLVESHPKLGKDLRFKSQMTSSAVSVASNIAEGDELKTQKQSINHFYIAKGSCAELITQLIIAKDINVINKQEAEELIRECDLLGVMLYNLIQSRIKDMNRNQASRP